MADRYEPATFESKWQARWKEADLFKTREDPGRPKFYGLDFFPYPSGAGLSVGHCRNYIPTDVLCRLKFMQGHNVLHPMGFDAFGLPAENEAISKHTHPSPMVHQYGDTYRRQMELVGISYDWSRSFYSCDPDYYRWTQWIFKLLYERGLAYRRLASVNWCPFDKTVLADEEVVGGLCWRCDNPVEKRDIPQWFFRITDYAQRLIDDLDDLDWPDGIKQQQRNWIGRSEGVEFDFKVATDGASVAVEEDFHVVRKEREPYFRIFTTRIDTIFGVTFCVLAPEHPLVETLKSLADEDRRAELSAYVDSSRRVSEQDRLATTRTKTGVFTGSYAVNPVNGKRVPIWVADYVLMGYGTGAIMAVPGHDERDFDFAKSYGLDIVQVIAPADRISVELPYAAKDGVLVNSGEYNGKTVGEAQHELGVWMEALGIGDRRVNYRLRDWLISRQRYWGCPIPVIHSQDGDMHAVSDSLLPVLLPDVENYEPSGDGTSPLAAIPEFVNVTDRDGRLGRRETDTMGGFACSSWYFLRFADPHNDDRAWDPERVKYWLPVDCYVGGAEHAVMHLLYARFWTKVLFDAGLIDFKEPFLRLQNQGQVLAKTPYRAPRGDETLKVGEAGIQISFEEASQMPPDEVIWRWARMSKSKGNVVTPDEAARRFGVDALRVYELFVAPFDADVEWSDEGMAAAVRFLSRVFKLVDDVRPFYDLAWRDNVGETASDIRARSTRRSTHQAIAKCTQDIEDFGFNTYIAALMTFVNHLSEVRNEALKSPPSPGVRAALSEGIESLILLLSPAAPHTADELWESIGRTGFTYLQDWPTYREELAKAEGITIAVQVNGKLRDTVDLPADAGEPEMKEAALSSEKIKAQIAGLTVRKVIVVPGKLVNVVAN